MINYWTILLLLKSSCEYRITKSGWNHPSSLCKSSFLDYNKKILRSDYWNKQYSPLIGPKILKIWTTPSIIEIRTRKENFHQQETSMKHMDSMQCCSCITWFEFHASIHNSKSKWNLLKKKNLYNLLAGLLYLAPKRNMHCAL